MEGAGSGLGTGADQGVTMHVRIVGWDETQNAAKVIGIQPCVVIGFSQRIDDQFTFFGSQGTKFEELWCDDGNFDRETKTLTFNNGGGQFYLYEKLE